MIITKETVDLLQEVYLHDSESVKIYYDQNEDLLELKMDNYFKKKKYKLIFENVIHFQVDAIQPWGKNYIVLDAFENKDDPFLKNCKLLQDRKDEEMKFSKLMHCDLKNYFSINIVMKSGDKITIIANRISCESFELL